MPRLASPPQISYPLHKSSVVIRRKFRHSLLAQGIALILLWLAGEVISHSLALPFPGSVIGMMLLFLALASGLIQPVSIRRGARWFLAELLLFFVPAVLAVLDHPEFLGTLGLKILIVIFAGIIAVMSTTAIAVDIGFRIMDRFEKRAP